MNAIGAALVSAILSILEALLKQESGFITEELEGVIGEGEGSLQVLLAPDVPIAQKEIIWKQAGAAIKGALKRTEDEAANIPNDIGADVLPFVLGLLEIDLEKLL
jgi:hypothetical protein